MLKIKLLIDELEAAGCELNEEQKLVTVLRVLDKNYNNVFSTLIERMLNESLTLDGVKAQLLSHECRLAIRKAIEISPLPTINVTVSKNLVNTILVSFESKVQGAGYNVHENANQFQQMNFGNQNNYGNNTQFNNN